MATDGLDSFEKWYARFRKTGDPHPLKEGLTRAQVQDLLGAPTDSGATSRKQVLPLILVYRDIELHFGPKPNDPLVMICPRGPHHSSEEGR